MDGDAFCNPNLVVEVRFGIGCCLLLKEGMSRVAWLRDDFGGVGGRCGEDEGLEQVRHPRFKLAFGASTGGGGGVCHDGGLHHLAQLPVDLLEESGVERGVRAL